jgi:ABC-type uncharacterized transport system substrate-binding protein
LTLPRRTFLAISFAAALGASPALSHPHVFAEAKMTLELKPNGTVDKIKHHWVFDDLFSSTVIVEFDKNEDLKLDPIISRRSATMARTSKWRGRPI